MNVIFYSSVVNEKAKAICRVLEKSDRSIGLEMHRSIDSLESRIKQPMNGIILVILNVASIEELSNLITLKERLHAFPVILIISDTGEGTMKKGRIFRPRFIFGADDDPEELGLIYKKMLSRIDVTNLIILQERSADKNELNQRNNIRLKEGK